MNKVYKVESLPKIGDRDDFLIRDTSGAVPLSISGTQMAILNYSGAANPHDFAQAIAEELAKLPQGFQTALKGKGLMFYSHNSPGTVEAILHKIGSGGIEEFLVEKVDRETYEESGLLDYIEPLKDKIYTKFNFVFIDPFESGSPVAKPEFTEPVTKWQDFLFNICVLAYITDLFTVEKIVTDSLTPIKKLEIWITFEKDYETARELTKPFAMVRDLRNQFPIHEHFDSRKKRQKKQKVIKAECFFGIKEAIENQEFDNAWEKVKKGFIDAFKELDKTLFPSS